MSARAPAYFSRIRQAPSSTPIPSMAAVSIFSSAPTISSISRRKGATRAACATAWPGCATMTATRARWSIQKLHTNNPNPPHKCVFASEPGAAHMSTDLKYLAFTAMLTASLWIPYVVAQIMTNGPLAPQNYVDPAPRPVPLWGKRADRAYLNAVETFAPFAALVILIQLTGKADAMTAFWAISYFWLRVAHAVVYLAGWPYIRTLIFVLGWICIVGLFVELVK